MIALVLVVPAPHGTHDVLPTVVLIIPSKHVVQAPPAMLIVPMGQLLHTLVEELYVPAAHWTHDALPDVLDIVPVGHCVQALVFPPPAMLVVPMGQASHDAAPAVA